MTEAHLLTTDESGLALFEASGDLRCVGVIFPENRAQSAKVNHLRRVCASRSIPVSMQPRGGALPGDLPAAPLAVSWLYSQIIPVGDLSRYSLGVMNMHGGHIPRYRGANVLQWAIINGETELWVTWHEVIELVDAGGIWAERPLPLPDDWTAVRAREAMIECGRELFPQAWQRKRLGYAPIRYPDLSEGRIWPSRRPRDGLVGPGLTQRQIVDLLRALCPPWPGPTIMAGGQIRHVIGLSEQAASDTEAYHCQDGPILHLVLGDMPEHLQ